MKEPDELKEIADELSELLEAYNIQGFDRDKSLQLLQRDDYDYDESQD